MVRIKDWAVSLQNVLLTMGKQMQVSTWTPRMRLYPACSEQVYRQHGFGFQIRYAGLVHYLDPVLGSGVLVRYAKLVIWIWCSDSIFALGLLFILGVLLIALP